MTILVLPGISWFTQGGSGVDSCTLPCRWKIPNAEHSIGFYGLFNPKKTVVVE